MSVTMARYRDSVTDLLEAGESFDVVEEAIDEVPDLSEDSKAALWMLAFSLRDSSDRTGAARAHLSVVD